MNKGDLLKRLTIINHCRLEKENEEVISFDLYKYEPLQFDKMIQNGVSLHEDVDNMIPILTIRNR